MNRSSLINVGLQFGFAAVRYGMMGWVYARSDLQAVGHISALLTYVTAITFVAGLELHQVVNRSLLLGQGSELRWGADRMVLAAAVIGVMAWMADSLLLGANRGAGFTVLVLLVATAEYLALELGRLLIAKERYLVAASCGFVRSVSPFLVAVVAQPTMEAMLCSWLVGTAAVVVVQAWLLWHAAYFRVKWKPLDWADYRSATLFFAAGGAMALMPTIERWLAGTFFSAAALGQYALAMTLVSVCELVVQGGIWQPFISRILQRLVLPGQRRSTVDMLLAAVAVVYLGGAALSLLVSGHLLAWINKAPLPWTMLMGVFALGLAKALYTLLFYCLYATGREQVLPKVQMFMVAALLLGVALGAHAGLDTGQAFSVVGAIWIALLLVLIRSWIAKGSAAAAG